MESPRKPQKTNVCGGVCVCVCVCVFVCVCVCVVCVCVCVVCFKLGTVLIF